MDKGQAGGPACPSQGAATTCGPRGGGGEDRSAVAAFGHRGARFSACFRLNCRAVREGASSIECRVSEWPPTTIGAHDNGIGHAGNAIQAQTVV